MSTDCGVTRGDTSKYPELEPQVGPNGKEHRCHDNSQVVGVVCQVGEVARHNSCGSFDQKQIEYKVKAHEQHKPAYFPTGFLAAIAGKDPVLVNVKKHYVRQSTANHQTDKRICCSERICYRYAGKCTHKQNVTSELEFEELKNVGDES